MVSRMDRLLIKNEKTGSSNFLRFNLAIYLVTILTVLLFIFPSYSHAGIGPINNECIDALQIFNGVTPFSTIDATTDGPPV